ncbi:MAG: hypothetical protein E7425_01785, partial [Ruminococcaceae bacterium]|nr:hypothetical protein [Oscillospiraceae bacterium]
MPKIRKNSFIEGTLAAYAAIVISKLLGVLYSIPFYSVIGESGGVIYSCVYNIYALFLDISTSGIPVAVSIVISGYNSLKMYRCEKRAYSVALKLVLILSAASFVILQTFAGRIGAYLLKDQPDGVDPAAIATGIRIIAVCLLIAPFLSVRRGLLLGRKYVATSSASQVVEQFVRIIVVLGGSYTVIRLMSMSTTMGVYAAFAGAAIGAAAAFLYIMRRSRHMEEPDALDSEVDYEMPRDGEIAKRLISYSLPIVIVSVATSVYSVVDMKMILHGLHVVGYTDEATQVIASVASTWVPRICMIIVALPTGLVSSMAPFAAESSAVGNENEVNFKLNQALSILLLISVPLGVGMITFAEPLYRVFYGFSEYGWRILRLSVIVNIVGGMATVIGITMQSMQRGKAVIAATLAGIIVNAGMDLPLIYLFHRLGIPAYLGAAMSSIIGQTVNVAVLVFILKRDHGFSFRDTLTFLVRIAVPTAAMLVVVLLARLIWPVVSTRGVVLWVQLAVYAAIGCIVYFPLCGITKALMSLFGETGTERLMKKFRIYNVYNKMMFFPALWAGKLFLFVYKRSGRVRDDR